MPYECTLFKSAADVRDGLNPFTDAFCMPWRIGLDFRSPVPKVRVWWRRAGKYHHGDQAVYDALGTGWYRIFQSLSLLAGHATLVQGWIMIHQQQCVTRNQAGFNCHEAMLAEIGEKQLNLAEISDNSQARANHYPPSCRYCCLMAF